LEDLYDILSGADYEPGCFKLILDSINEGVALYDKYGNVVFINQYIRQNFKDTFHENENIYNQISDEIYDVSFNRIKNFEIAVNSKNDMTFDDCIDGSWYRNRLYPICVNGTVEFVTVISEDVTELKKAEKIRMESELLKKKEHDFVEILDGSTIASWVNDFGTHTFICSPEWKRLIGAENIKNEELFEYVNSLVHPQDEKRIELERGAVIENRQSRFKLEYRIRMINGNYTWILDQGKILYNEEGMPTKVYGTTMDIDDYKQIESALQISKQHAVDLVDQLKSEDRNKNHFISILSHELRNPLATMMAAMSYLRKVPDKNDHDSTISIIERQANQLSKLVDDLLDLTRINNNKIKLKMECINLNTIALGTYHDLKPLFRNKSINFRIELSEDCYITADPIRIKQIIENLLYNAYKYTDYNGEVLLQVTRNDKEAIISVKDNGKGISPDVAPYIFNPFIQAEKTLDRSDGGLGLGLAVAKRITELHEGRVYSFSEGKGKGSEFVIILPLGEKPASNDIPETKPKENNERRTILLIDDNVDFGTLMCSILESNGYIVDYSSSSHTGLRKALDLNYHIIICDIGLPEIDGYEIARLLKSKHGAACPKLIALSGYAGNEDKQLAIQSGFDLHFAKPLDFIQFEEILNHE
jgi:signal transduction histidine kinase/CheY-like chemotaxis protein